MAGAHIHEYRCRQCGATFTGDGEPTEEHYSNEFGDWAPGCGGTGDLVVSYLTPTIVLEDD